MNDAELLAALANKEIEKLKVGMRVRIKPYDEIKDTLDHEDVGPLGVYFNNSMKKHCGKTCIVKTDRSNGDRCELDQAGPWTWERTWLEEVHEWDA